MNINLLFVDDEPAILRSLSMLFRNDANVFIADNGAEALELLRNNRMHVIVSDQRMPEMTGIDVLKQAFQISPNTLRILLTGYADLTAIVGSVNEGEVYRYINKPWDRVELKELVLEAAELSIQTYAAEEEQSLTQGKADIESKPSAVVSTDTNGAILVLDDDPEAYHVICNMLGENAAVFSATSLAEAHQILRTKSIEIIVAELKLNEGYTIGFIKALKQKYPSILTLVQAKILDSEHVIDLINQGRIFRYLPKPVRQGLLKLSINRALEHVQAQITKPILVKQQRVRPKKILPSTPKPALTIDTGLLNRLRALGDRLREATEVE